MALLIKELPEEPKEQFGCAGALVIIVIVLFIIFKCSGEDTTSQKEVEPTPIEQPVETISTDEAPGNEVPDAPVTLPKPTALPQVKPRAVAQPAKEPEVEKSIPVIEYHSFEASSPEPEISDREQRKADRKARRDARKVEREQRRQNQ